MNFGTDGIRGKYGVEVTEATAWAIGNATRVLGRHVAIARDTRPSGPALEEAVVAGIVAAGGYAVRFGVLPTPALATVLAADASWHAGVMITASHNPVDDNGLKLLDGAGRKLGGAARTSVEIAAETPVGRSGGAQRGDPEATSRYVSWMRANAPRIRGKVALDTGNGAAWGLARRILEDAGATVVEVDMGDGARINAGVGALHPEALRAAVLAQKCDVGIALDGDGDRVTIVTATGRILDGDALLWLCRPAVGNVVGTVMTNVGLEAALGRSGIGLTRTQVGDSAVAVAMAEIAAEVGGEPSGHILFAPGPPTADGLYVALRTCSGDPRSLDERLSGYVPAAQRHATLPASAWSDAWEPVAAAIERAGGRVVVRRSGTESVVRLMVEHEQAGVAAEGLDSLVRSLGGS